MTLIALNARKRPVWAFRPVGKLPAFDPETPHAATPAGCGQARGLAVPGSAGTQDQERLAHPPYRIVQLLNDQVIAPSGNHHLVRTLCLFVLTRGGPACGSTSGELRESDE